jgi:homoserine dehydrogenase
LRGQELRQITLEGPGAGGAETATAVLGDLLGVIGSSGTGFLQHDGYYRSLPMVPPDRVETPLYVRLSVDDRPGVLAQIAARLAGRGVSVESLVQRPEPDGGATLVLLTHAAPEGDAFAAIDEVAGLDLCRRTPTVLRLLAA